MVKRNTTTRDQHRRSLRAAAGPCHICGAPIDYTLPYHDPMSFVADHVVPLTRGGADALANKAPAHRDCNRTKGAREFADIIKRSGSLRRPGA